MNLFFEKFKSHHVRNSDNSGFTLVEILVALMIFALVIVVALAALVKILDANKKAQTIQDAVVSLSFVTEAMTRELRTGSTLYCHTLAPNTDLSVTALSNQDVTDCAGVDGSTGNGAGFAFLSGRGGPSCNLIIAYEFVPNNAGGGFDGTFSFKKAIQSNCGDPLVFTPVVATSSVAITSYFIQVNNTQYPLTFIKLDGNAGTKESIRTQFSLQTAASMRTP